MFCSFWNPPPLLLLLLKPDCSTNFIRSGSVATAKMFNYGSF